MAVDLGGLLGAGPLGLSVALDDALSDCKNTSCWRVLLPMGDTKGKAGDWSGCLCTCSPRLSVMCVFGALSEPPCPCTALSLEIAAELTTVCEPVRALSLAQPAVFLGDFCAPELFLCGFCRLCLGDLLGERAMGRVCVTSGWVFVRRL